MLHLLVWLLGWLRVHCLGFLNASMVCWRWRRHRESQQPPSETVPLWAWHTRASCRTATHEQGLAGGTHQENFAADFASEIPGKCKKLPIWCFFSAVLGICQFLKHRRGTKKEVKWSISTYNLQFLLPLVNIVTKMGRNLSGASEQALHLTSLSCILQWPWYNWVRRNESH